VIKVTKLDLSPLKTFGKTHYIAEITEKLEGEKVTLTGWVYRKREHGKLVFIILRDGTGTIQVTIHKDKVDERSFKDARKVSLESAVKLTGIVKRDPRAPGGVEIQATSFEIVSLAEPWPITKDAGKVFLLDMRHLHIRSFKVRTILYLRSEICRYMREFLHKKGFVEIHAPIIITAACEGGATLFPLKYFGRKAYLTQSAQLYEEAAITSLEKVYTIAPGFRSEKSRTRRHLTEFWMVECEIAFATHEDIMKLQEELVTYVCEKIVEEHEKELKEILNREFKPPTIPFERITYTEALDLLREKAGIELPWGEDFGAEAERELSKMFDQPFFVTHFPTVIRSFYHQPDPENPEVTLSSDLMAPEGYGELSSGGVRISDYDLLVKRIKEQNLPLESYSWYLDLRKYGIPPHAGFGIGIERLTAWICGLEHVRDTTLFPRTPSRVYP